MISKSKLLFTSVVPTLIITSTTKKEFEGK